MLFCCFVTVELPYSPTIRERRLGGNRAVTSRPPIPAVSTSLTLHPERDFAGTASVTFPLSKSAKGMEAVVEDVIGEEGMQVLPRQFTSVSIALVLSPKLAGGHHRADEDWKLRRTALKSATTWSSEGADTASLNACHALPGR